MRPFFRFFLVAWLSAICFAASAPAGEPPPLVPFGHKHPQPRQLGLDEIESVPVDETPCPVCGFAVAVPQMDTLMRGVDPGPWVMHAASRDSDLCPYPGKGKVAFQADIVICPSCGYAAQVKEFSENLPPELRAWSLETLKPSLRAVQLRLLGRRGREMSETEIVAFFNRQADIPDRIRCEHARVVLAARRAPASRRAEMAWRAAWACRHALNAPPNGDFLRDRGSGALAQVDKRSKSSLDAAERLAALQHLLGKKRSGEFRLNPAERVTARLLLAGAHDRLGQAAAETELSRLFVDARERFSRPEQDPLWPLTAGKVARAARPLYLEQIRGEIELEVESRLSLLAAERDYLGEAASLLREALLADEFATPDSALHHAYLIADFLRRRGNLPLAWEWAKTVENLATANPTVPAATERLLAAIREQAADSVNLLAGIGHDGEFIDKLRKICENQ